MPKGLLALPRARVFSTHERGRDERRTREGKKKRDFVSVETTTTTSTTRERNNKVSIVSGFQRRRFPTARPSTHARNEARDTRTRGGSGTSERVTRLFTTVRKRKKDGEGSRRSNEGPPSLYERIIEMPDVGSPSPRLFRTLPPVFSSSARCPPPCLAFLLQRAFLPASSFY